MNSSALTSAADRLVDYVVIVGTEATKGGLLIPVVLDRLPRTDHLDTPFPTGVASFCMPYGAQREIRAPLPKFFTFIATGAKGEHMYGYTLLLWERVDLATSFVADRSDSVGAQLTTENSDRREFAPVALTLLSRWVFPTPFRVLLTEVYRLSLSPQPLPLERLLISVSSEIPLPPAGRADVQYTIGTTTLTFRRPPPNRRVATFGLPFREVFECLDASNVLILALAVACERQVLLVSSQLSLLTAAAEVAVALAYPLKWCHVCVPVMPAALASVVLQSPTPFLVGILSSRWSEVVCGAPPAASGDVSSSTNGTAASHINSGGASESFPARVVRRRSSLDSGEQEAAPPLQPGIIVINLDTNTVAVALNAGDPPPNPPGAEFFNLRPLGVAAVTGGIASAAATAATSSAPPKLYWGAVTASELPALPDRQRSKLMHALATHADAFSRRGRDWHSMRLPMIDSAFAFAARPSEVLGGAGNDDDDDCQGGAAFGGETDEDSDGNGTIHAPWGRAAHVSRPIHGGADGHTSHHDTSLGRARSGHTIFSGPAVRRAFFRMWVSLFSSYREYLRFPLPGDDGRRSRFDRDGFLRAAASDARPLLRALMDTQAFANFVDDRIQPGADSDADVTFFDESIIAKSNRSRFTFTKKPTPFLSARDAFSITKTVVALPPPTSDLPDFPNKLYSYECFPRRLDDALLVDPRPVPIFADVAGGGGASVAVGGSGSAVGGGFGAQRTLIASVGAAVPSVGSNSIIGSGVSSSTATTTLAAAVIPFLYSAMTLGVSTGSAAGQIAGDGRGLQLSSGLADTPATASTAAFFAVSKGAPGGAAKLLSNAHPHDGAPNGGAHSGTTSAAGVGTSTYRPHAELIYTTWFVAFAAAMPIVEAVIKRAAEARWAASDRAAALVAEEARVRATRAAMQVSAAAPLLRGMSISDAAQARGSARAAAAVGLGGSALSDTQSKGNTSEVAAIWARTAGLETPRLFAEQPHGGFGGHRALQMGGGGAVRRANSATSVSTRPGSVAAALRAAEGVGSPHGRHAGIHDDRGSLNDELHGAEPNTRLRVVASHPIYTLSATLQSTSRGSNATQAGAQQSTVESAQTRSTHSNIEASAGSSTSGNEVSHMQSVHKSYAPPAKRRASVLSVARARYLSAALDAAFAVLKRMRSEGYAPDEIAYRCLIEVCGRAGDLPRARHLVNDMVADGAKPGADLYRALFAAFHAGSAGLGSTAAAAQGNLLPAIAATAMRMPQLAAANATPAVTSSAVAAAAPAHTLLSVESNTHQMPTTRHSVTPTPSHVLQSMHAAQHAAARPNSAPSGPDELHVNNERPSEITTDTDTVTPPPFLLGSKGDATSGTAHHPMAVTSTCEQDSNIAVTAGHPTTVVTVPSRASDLDGVAHGNHAALRESQLNRGGTVGSPAMRPVAHTADPVTWDADAVDAADSNSEPAVRMSGHINSTDLATASHFRSFRVVPSSRHREVNRDDHVTQTSILLAEIAKSSAPSSTPAPPIAVSSIPASVAEVLLPAIAVSGSNNRNDNGGTGVKIAVASSEADTAANAPALPSRNATKDQQIGGVGAPVLSAQEAIHGNDATRDKPVVSRTAPQAYYAIGGRRNAEQAADATSYSGAILTTEKTQLAVPHGGGAALSSTALIGGSGSRVANRRFAGSALVGHGGAGPGRVPRSSAHSRVGSVAHMLRSIAARAPGAGSWAVPELARTMKVQAETTRTELPSRVSNRNVVAVAHTADAIQRSFEDEATAGKSGVSLEIETAATPPEAGFPEAHASMAQSHVQVLDSVRVATDLTSHSSSALEVVHVTSRNQLDSRACQNANASNMLHEVDQSITRSADVIVPARRRCSGSSCTSSSSSSSSSDDLHYSDSEPDDDNDDGSDTEVDALRVEDDSDNRALDSALQFDTSTRLHASHNQDAALTRALVSISGSDDPSKGLVPVTSSIALPTSTSAPGPVARSDTGPPASSSAALAIQSGAESTGLSTTVTAATTSTTSARTQRASVITLIATILDRAPATAVLPGDRHGVAQISLAAPDAATTRLTAVTPAAVVVGQEPVAVDLASNSDSTAVATAISGAAMTTGIGNGRRGSAAVGPHSVDPQPDSHHDGIRSTATCAPSRSSATSTVGGRVALVLSALDPTSVLIPAVAMQAAAAAAASTTVEPPTGRDSDVNVYASSAAPTLTHSGSSHGAPEDATVHGEFDTDVAEGEAFEASAVLAAAATAVAPLTSTFPGLTLDTLRETCPTCDRLLSDVDIRAGWSSSSSEYTTTCPACPPAVVSARPGAALERRRFVARFAVSAATPTWVGSGGVVGAGAPLLCEYLPPAVLLKELVATVGSGRFSAHLRTDCAALFWNLLLWCVSSGLPCEWLAALAM